MTLIDNVSVKTSSEIGGQSRSDVTRWKMGNLSIAIIDYSAEQVDKYRRS